MPTPTSRLNELIGRTQNVIDTLPPRPRSKAHYCFGRCLTLCGESELATKAFAAVTHQPERELAQQALNEPPHAKASTAASPLSQLDALLRQGEMDGAELLITRMKDDFERIAAFTDLARTRLAGGERQECRRALRQAETIWRLNRNEWWFFPWLGSHLRTLIECGEVAWAEGVMEVAGDWVAAEGSQWLQIHGWCGLAQGAALLSQEIRADAWISIAQKIAEQCGTRRKRSEAQKLIVMALFEIGRVDHALEVAKLGGHRQEFEALLTALRIEHRRCN